jgi:hypothetical protein
MLEGQKPISEENLFLMQQIAKVVRDADVVALADGRSRVRLRFRWWNKLFLGIPGRNARRELARRLFPIEVV